MLDTMPQPTIAPFRGQETIEVYKEANIYTLPKKATIFTSTHYTDGDSWTVLENPLKLKQTIFSDDRLLLLKALDSKDIPVDMEPSLCGKYDIKLYGKKGVYLCFEGDHKILIKIPSTKTIISWNSTERFPVLMKSWRPTFYMLNDDNIFIRYIPESSLVINKVSNEDSYKVKCISFTDGFVCCHPINNLALLNGAYDQNQTKNTMELPIIPKSNGNYRYIIMFYHWGTMIIPKTVELVKGPLCNAKSSCLALIIIPPKLHFMVEFKTNGSINRVLDYGKDFHIAARKPSMTDLEVFLVMYDQLVKIEHSFDIRLNKEKNPIAYIRVPFVFKVSKEEKEKKKKDPSYQCKWTFDNVGDQKVLIPASNSLGDEHLMTADFACLFDAEDGTYYSTEYGIKHCKVFAKLKA